MHKQRARGVDSEFGIEPAALGHRQGANPVDGFGCLYVGQVYRYDYDDGECDQVPSRLAARLAFKQAVEADRKD